MQEREQLNNSISQIKKLEQQMQDAVDMIELAELEDDDELVTESEAALVKLGKHTGRLQLQSLLSGEADNNDCFIEINAGAGGTEAQDWAEMLSRMYMRWAEEKGYKLECLEENIGEEAGIKSITYKVKGHQAYGWLKTESGVHRLVRI